MYVKFGRIDKSWELFDKIHVANMVSWIAMIRWYAFHAYNKNVLKVFVPMKHLVTNLDDITFVCILLACTHAGLMDKGCK